MKWILLLLIVCGYLIYIHYFPRIPSYKPTYDYALLLGCPTHADGSLCRSQIKRCNLAIEEYKKGAYTTLVICGGAVKNQYVESEAMASYIQERIPIPLHCETKSRNTFENFSNAKDIIQDQSVLVLTSSCHARRSCAIAKQFFKHYSAAWYPDYKPKHIIRECISRIIYISIEIKKKFSSLSTTE